MIRLTGDCTVSNLSMLTYNILGNGASGWTLASTNVQAVGRQLSYLNPDIIGFQEVPEDFRLQMPNFIGSYLPGHYVANGSSTGGSGRSAVASITLLSQDAAKVNHYPASIDEPRTLAMPRTARQEGNIRSSFKQCNRVILALRLQPFQG